MPDYVHKCLLKLGNLVELYYTKDYTLMKPSSKDLTLTFGFWAIQLEFPMFNKAVVLERTFPSGRISLYFPEEF